MSRNNAFKVLALGLGVGLSSVCGVVMPSAVYAQDAGITAKEIQLSVSAEGKIAMPADWKTQSPAVFAKTLRKLLDANIKAKGEGLTTLSTQKHRSELADTALKLFTEGKVLSDKTWYSNDFNVLLQYVTDELGDAQYADGKTVKDFIREQVEAKMMSDQSLLALDWGILKARTYWSMKLRGISQEKIDELLQRWIVNHDLSKLSLQEKINISNDMARPQLDRHKLSIQWTGNITPNTSGEYVFSRKHIRPDIGNYIHGNLSGKERFMKVWIGEQLVMDTSDRAFVSVPVRLNAGQSQGIKIDFCHLSNHSMPLGRFPVADLAWSLKDSQTDAVSVPDSVFTTSNEEGQVLTGLTGRYYGDNAFKELKVSRVDPTIQCSWYGGTIACKNQSQRDQIMKHATTEFLDSDYLDKSEDRGLAPLRMQEALANTMNSSQALEFVNKIKSNPALFKDVSDRGGAAYHANLFATLPGQPMQEYLADLVAEVKDTADEFETVLLEGYGERYPSYWNKYRVYAWQMTNDLQVQKLRERLENRDGSANVFVGKVLVFGTYLHTDISKEWFEYIKEKTEDQQITGDAKASWLEVQSMVDEVGFKRMHSVDRGLPVLLDAFAEAESSEYRVKLAQSIAAKYAVLGRYKEATQFISSVEDASAVGSGVDNWLVQIKKMQSIEVDREKVIKVRDKALEVKGLEERLIYEKKRGDQRTIDRFVKSLAKQRQQLKTLEKDRQDQAFN